MSGLPGLKVSQCEEAGCELVCDAPAGFNSIGLGPSSGPLIICNPSWDCSDALWSECDSVTKTRTRNIAFCEFTGTGDEACEEESFAELKDEEDCIVGGGVKVVERTAKPASKEPAEEGFPWFWLLLGLLLLAVGGGAAYYFLTHKKKAAGAGGAKAGESPFANPNDLNALMNYIKLSKQRNVPDAKIVVMLKRSGWRDDQIKFAWMKLAKPQTAGQAKPAQQPNQK